MSAARVVCIALFVTAWGCLPMRNVDPGGDRDTAAHDTATDGEEAPPRLVLDCAEDLDAFAELEVLETEMPTVFEVRWRSEEATRAAVSYAMDPGSQVDLALSVAPQTEHTWLLRGLPASKEVVLRVWDEAGRCSAEEVVHTGALSPELPLLTHSGDDDPELGFVFTPVITPEAQFLTVIDAKGRYVWALPVSGTPMRLEAGLAPDRMLSLRQAASATAPGAIEWYDWRGERIGEVIVPGAHTDFALASDGTVYVLCWELRTLEHEGQSRKILGDRVVAVDPQTGAQREVWSSFDMWPPDLDQTWDHGTYPDDQTVEDYLHTNGLSVDRGDGSLLLSIAREQSVASVSVETGALEWSLGEHPSSLIYPGGAPSDLVENPHSVFRNPDGTVVIFNRMFYTGEDACSEATIVAISEERGEATLVGALESEDCLSVYFLGQARPIGDDGRTLVTWTTAGRIDQYDAEHEVIWSVSAALGAGMTYSDHRTSLY